ncbi:MAG: DUF4260 domain-containing protein [Actinomycetota bacterium]|nr:DUF4260 domain-containing protein [Actinomycetota bacterium]
MSERSPVLLLRLEGLAILAGALVLYFDRDFGVLLLVLLFLAPDLSFAAYLAGPRVGAAVYNATHFLGWPVILAVTGLVAVGETPVQLGVIWAAHIGLDRILGYGFKYPTAFKDTHLQRV